MLIDHHVLSFLQAQQQPPGWVQFVPLLIMFLLFYVIWWLPMRRRQKAHEKMLQELQKGDRVVTSGGLYGEVAAVEEKVVLLKVADSVRVRVARASISGLQGDQEGGGSR